jgi:hypothetical protein
MQPMFKHFLAGSLAVGLMGAGGAAQAAAAYTWSIATGGNPTISSSPPGGPTATVTGWAESNSTSPDSPFGGNLYQVGSTELVYYSGSGLGMDRVEVDNNGSGSGDPYNDPTTPEPDSFNHALDSDGADEALRLVFSQAIALTSVSAGWARQRQCVGYSTNSDCGSTKSQDLAGIDVLAYTGAGTPDLTTLKWSDINTSSSWKTFTGSVTSSADFAFNTSGAQTSSTIWLVRPSATTSLQNGDSIHNYAKIDGFGGSIPDKPNPPTTKVPVPAPLALMVAGLPLLRLARRTR